jgi:hypothetical protein
VKVTTRYQQVLTGQNDIKPDTPKPVPAGRFGRRLPCCYGWARPQA